MKAITEDYVSFETAKLLKEKGFDENCWCWYEEDGYFRESNDNFGVQSNSDHVINDDEFNCSAPTLQMAMKWLREVHNLFIDSYYDCDFGEEYKFSVHKLPKGTTLESHNENYSTYEEAVEAAIKYCLENLI